MLGPKLGPFILVAIYAGASIYFELYPERAYTRLTDQTPRNASDLAKRVTAAAGAGYAISHGAVEAGGSSIAAPVRDREGRIVAAIDISAPDSAFDLDKFESRDVPEVVAAANRISARLGYVEPKSPARGRTTAARARARG